MKKSMLMGTPVYYFTDINYENYTYSELSDPDEGSFEIHYSYHNLKTQQQEKGIAFHNMPLFPTYIPAVQYALNVDEFGEGDYAINRSISYEECLQIYDSLLEGGIPPEEITVEVIKQKMDYRPKKL